MLRVRTSDLRRLLATGTRAPKRDDLLSPEQLARRDFGLKILSWYRDLIAKKYDGSARRGAGRPASAAAVQQLVVRFASGNPSWGTTRIRGALRNLGHELGRNTIKRIVLDHGLEPAPARRKRMPWKTFLKAHLGAICAVDLRHAVTEFVVRRALTTWGATTRGSTTSCSLPFCVRERQRDGGAARTAR